MKFKGTIGTQYSGSIAGVTASHNRGGAFLRSRVIPVNPNTTFQQAVRTIFGTLSSYWLSTLTPAERDAWNTYALNVLIPDSLGEPRNVGGLGMFKRSNVPRVQAGITTTPQVDAAPTEFNLGSYTAPTVGAISAGGGTLSLAFTNTDEWANEDEAAMFVLISRGLNASVNYFKGPYRFAGQVLGDGTTAPTSPASITLPFTVAIGQRVYVSVRVSRADGRLSTPFRGNGLAVA
jgi:hypothetical protein